MNPFQPFEMERMMSKFEKEVEYNLSESGVHPLPVRELIKDNPKALNGLLDTHLGYPHVNGNPQLRRHIADLYQGAGIENVLVTVGAIEANYISIRTQLSTGDEIAVMLPNYMQIWGIAKNHQLKLKTFRLREENDWALDLDELNSEITPNTRLIAICNPNNPTGHVLTDAEMEAVIACADRVGAWILADEVYRGATRAGLSENPSFYGRYDKVLAIGSMSKAYGLAGLRIGWVVAPKPAIEEIWARHEYVAISASMLSNQLAAHALSPEVRPRLLQRTQKYIDSGLPVLQKWADSHTGMFAFTRPDATAIAFLRYHLGINSTELAERLRKEHSVLIVPGDHFGMDHFVRVNFGLPREYLTKALDRIHNLLEQIQNH